MSPGLATEAMVGGRRVLQNVEDCRIAVGAALGIGDKTPKPGVVVRQGQRREDEGRIGCARNIGAVAQPLVAGAKGPG